MPIVRLPKGELRDEIRQPLYDTIDLANGVDPTGQQSFFSAVQGKSKVRSNLRQNNSLETAVSFRIQGLCLDAQNFRIANNLVIPQILERSSLELQVGEKVYWTGSARFAAGRMQVEGGGDTTTIHQQYGWAAIQPVILMGRHVVDINPLQNFSGLWTIGDATVTEVAAYTPAIGDLVGVKLVNGEGLLAKVNVDFSEDRFAVARVMGLLDGAVELDLI